MDNRDKIKQLRRLPLEGTMNTRDLGGYPCAGGVTRWGAFLRSDSPHNLTDTDIETLKEYGVKNAVDLRSVEEKAEWPTLLRPATGFTSYHVSLSDQLHSADYEGDTPGSMAGLYIALMENSDLEIREIFKIFSQTQEGTLFHCAVGKDRTGVVAMLLLQLAGVDDADIVADYIASEIYMREIFDTQAKSSPLFDENDPRFRSRPKSMWRALRHLRESHGDAQRYLKAIGLSGGEIETVRQKLVG